MKMAVTIFLGVLMSAAMLFFVYWQWNLAWYHENILPDWITNILIWIGKITSFIIFPILMIGLFFIKDYKGK